MKALVRRPSPRLGNGLVTHVPRRPVDVALAQAQWQTYVDTLATAGWEIVEVPPADDCPDSVFVEDAAVIAGDVVVVTRPGAPARRAETEGIEGTLQRLGCRIARIASPGTLDGGDVLLRGATAYVGVGRRTNAAGASQLRELTGLDVVPLSVPDGYLHLKSATTLLSDGSRIDANVLDLGDGRILVAAGDEKAIPIVEERGFGVVAIDISELQKLEGGVTCLSIRFRPTISQ